MTTPEEPMESIRERARRALRDNDEARLQAQMMAEGSGRPPAVVPDSPYRRAPEPLAWIQAPATHRVPVPEPEVEKAVSAPAPLVEEPASPAPVPEAPVSEAPNLLERRMRAIQLVRELDPRRNCFRQRVQELQLRLGQTPTDSVHYAQILERLAEVHAELGRLERQIEEARHVIRSTEWLMEMLTDPTRSWGGKAREELDALVR